MHICLYVDPLGTVHTPPNEEYVQIEHYLTNLLREHLPTFQRDVKAERLTAEQRCDLYVFDVGGLCAEGCDITHQYRALFSAIANRPSTLFVLWSAFTARYYWQEVARAYRAQQKAANVAVRVQPLLEFEARVVTWFQERAPAGVEEKPLQAPAAPVVGEVGGVVDDDDDIWGDLLRS